MEKIKEIQTELWNYLLDNKVPVDVAQRACELVGELMRS